MWKFHEFHRAGASIAGGRHGRGCYTSSMSSLLWPIAAMFVLAILLAVGSWRLAGHTPAAIVMGLLAAGMLIVWGVWLADNLLLVRWLPVTDAIVWLNPQLPAAGVLAGVAWRRMTGPAWQRIVLVVPLALLGIWRAYGPLWGTVPPLQPHRMTGSVVRQSTTSTCSPAAAATALRIVGINATEADLAGICLTRETGTTQLGLWRGLRLATAGTPVRAVPFIGPLNDLAAAGATPAVVSISLAGQQGGFLPTPGNRHAVAILAFNPDGTVEVADPFAGQQTWPLARLREAWTGQAIVLHVLRDSHYAP